MNKDIRKSHIEYINLLKQKTELSTSKLATKAKLSSSTLTRFLSKDNHRNLSTTSLNKLAKVAGYESYERFLMNERSESKQKTKINDDLKFRIYDIAKKHSEKLPASTITSCVIDNLIKLNTDFVTENFVIYIIEKMDFDN